MNNDWKKEYLQRFCKKEKDLDIPMHEELGVSMASEITKITYILADNPEVIDFIQSLLDKQIKEIYNDLSNNSKKINNSFNFIEKYVSMNYIRRLLTN